MDSEGDTLVEFSPVDELGCYFDGPEEPNNIHLEAWVRGHLDPARLRDAVLDTLAAHPFARARRVPPLGWDRRLVWEIKARPDVSPVDVVEWRTPDELSAHRQRVLAGAPPLDLAPLLRICHAVGPDQDAVILNAHHAALDGLSCLRLLRSIARRYAGRPDPVSAGHRPSRTPAGQPPVDGRRRSWQPATRITPDRPEPLPGYGYHLATLAYCPGRHRPKPAATVNDVLLATLMTTVTRWNSEHDQPTGTLRITMPLDARPPAAGDALLGNLSRLATVTSDRPERGDAERLLADIARQTTAAKRGGPQLDGYTAALASPRLPVPVKVRLVSLARRTAIRLFTDTALLSNLGPVTDPPDFRPATEPDGAGLVDALWFSGPAPMPRGLAVGVVTLHDRVQVCFRYRLALFDERAAARFVELFGDCLGTLNDPRFPAGTPP